MSYTDLSSTMRNIIDLNYEFMYKALILIIFLVIAIIYVKTYKPKKSPFWGVTLLRTSTYMTMWLWIFMFPLSLLLLMPTVSFEVILNIVVIIYSIIMTIYLLVFAINIPYYGVNFFFDLVDIPNELNDMNRDFVNKHFGRIKQR